MGLNGSKKEEANESKGRAAEVPLRKGRIARRTFSANFVGAQRFLPDYFFVTETNSSLFVDEDGDTANEFYRESFEKHKRLTKLGRVKYPIPRLHPDVPLVLWEVHQER
uniref:Uncharacterized protein n=1 Tax=Parascaris univalens TaxID=6257 RepID=A0A915BIC8_PARUN